MLAQHQNCSAWWPKHRAVLLALCVFLQVCNDVPYTTYTTQCQTVTKTKTQCDVVYNQKCDKVRMLNRLSWVVIAT